MLTQRQLKELFAENDFRPLKRLGENYLIDTNIKDKIISELSLKRNDTVLEVGPGFGALTFDIAGSGARTIAVEKDRKAYSILVKLLAGEYPNLELVCGDITEFNIAGIDHLGRIKIVGNLPYYITTPIVELIINNRESISSAVIMVQREVANRFLALPGSKDYGSVSCFVQYYAAGKYVHTVKRTSFYPQPDVDSSIIRLDIRNTPAVGVKDEGLFFRIIRSSFNQRRKSIINSLSRKEAIDIPKDSLADILKGVGVDPVRRPETLSLAEFAKISDSIPRIC